jgi:polyisoprenoid-binding protein YceI
MQSLRRLFVPLAFVLVLAACKSEIDEKTAAQVTETSATSSTAQTQQVTSSSQVIKERSKIGFIGAKVTQDHPGVFTQFDGRIDYAGTQPASINFTINPGSADTKIEKLNAHLKSADFFDVAKYPEATFVSNSVRPIQGDPVNTHEVCGVLTLHGVSKDVCFPAKVDVTPEGVHATADFKINRHDWGVSYKGAPDNLIKDDVAIQLDLWFPPAPTA